jgi:hypothetical protein
LAVQFEFKWASTDMGLSPDEKWMAALEGTWIPVREFDYDKGRVFGIHRIVKYPGGKWWWWWLLLGPWL